jgi:mannose-6-phosphate isomerase-like protein (cupin superfamily)
LAEIKKVNLAKAFASFSDHWSPRIAGELNDSYIKLCKVQGEFVWHHHDDEDELFLIVRGRLNMRFRDHDVWLDPGEFIIVPRGVVHMPVAPDGCELILMEPKSTLHTGNVVNERTVKDLQRIEI